MRYEDQRSYPYKRQRSWYHFIRTPREYSRTDHNESSRGESRSSSHDRAHSRSKNSWNEIDIYTEDGYMASREKNDVQGLRLDWMSKYKHMMWDNYEDVRLDFFERDDNVSDDKLRFFSDLSSSEIGSNSNATDHRDTNSKPDNIGMIQDTRMSPHELFKCIQCLKQHPRDKCERTRCGMCFSALHSLEDCPWSIRPKEPLSSCLPYIGEGYYLNSRLDHSVYRRILCNSYHVRDEDESGSESETSNAEGAVTKHSCTIRGYEDSIKMMGDPGSKRVVEDLGVLCYNCSGVGHIICNSEPPLNDDTVMSCAICKEFGHNLKMCKNSPKLKLVPNTNKPNKPPKIRYYSELDDEVFESAVLHRRKSLPDLRSLQYGRNEQSADKDNHRSADKHRRSWGCAGEEDQHGLSVNHNRPGGCQESEILGLRPTFAKEREEVSKALTGRSSDRSTADRTANSGKKKSSWRKGLWNKGGRKGNTIRAYLRKYTNHDQDPSTKDRPSSSSEPQERRWPSPRIQEFIPVGTEESVQVEIKASPKAQEERKASPRVQVKKSTKRYSSWADRPPYSRRKR
ncbi:hypothetical protein OIY81_3186 [Cryptosporidium canis]|uniref:Uncharacterized protein n=1 Tax=Cryptosporidium canis TaxID=195482 RepID=A0ABQ8P4M1_9CRYT|nr:hypothetical protein OIY81_3186 [Cryptosporidium canis]KAJ1608023.1 hypothetical protein OJ252_2660 [Cryptosporidium canis]